MPSIRPLPEKEATGETKQNYQNIKEALHLPTTPLFFLYLGPFPEYLSYITHQLVANLTHPDFEQMVKDRASDFRTQIKNELPHGERIEGWRSLYAHSPSYYYFQRNLRDIFETNVKLVYIFIGLREAIKGWAVAAKKLTGETAKSAPPEVRTEGTSESFIFDDVAETMNQLGKRPTEPQIRTNAMTAAQRSPLEIDLLPTYLELCKLYFSLQMKRETFLSVRVNMEETVLADIQVLPEIIFSPINIILRLTGKYAAFPDLLYLLSEHFPTYSMQRMMFSGFMME